LSISLLRDTIKTERTCRIAKYSREVTKRQHLHKLKYNLNVYKINENPIC
jgi:hypothetical protein